MLFYKIMIDRKVGRRALLGAAAVAAVAPLLDIVADKVLASKEIKAGESVTIIDADVVISPDLIISRPLLSRLFGKPTSNPSGETVVRQPILTKRARRQELLFQTGDGSFGKVELTEATVKLMRATPIDEEQYESRIRKNGSFSPDVLAHAKSETVHRATSVFNVEGGKPMPTVFHVGKDGTKVPVAYVRGAGKVGYAPRLS